eukprot:INCI5935.6.p1 GENE.INCI5935.6~~INCI5935.6.p1  ORF type:complete len:810 (-),score=129.05 INCI5935.6:239-2668(-)
MPRTADQSHWRRVLHEDAQQLAFLERQLLAQKPSLLKREARPSAAAPLDLRGRTWSRGDRWESSDSDDVLGERAATSGPRVEQPSATSSPAVAKAASARASSRSHPVGNSLGYEDLESYDWERRVATFLKHSRPVIDAATSSENESRTRPEIRRVCIVPFAAASRESSTAPVRPVDKSDTLWVNVTESTTFEDLADVYRHRVCGSEGNFSVGFCGESGAVWHHRALVRKSLEREGSSMQRAYFRILRDVPAGANDDGTAYVFVVQHASLPERKLVRSFATDDRLYRAHYRAAQRRQKSARSTIAKDAALLAAMDNRGTTRCKDLLWKLDVVISVGFLAVVAIVATLIQHEYTSLQKSFDARFLQTSFPCGNESLVFEDISTREHVQCFFSPSSSPVLQFLFSGSAGVCTASGDGVTGVCADDDGAVHQPVAFGFCDNAWQLLDMFGIVTFCDFYEDLLRNVSGPAQGRRQTSLNADGYLLNSFSQVVGNLTFFTSRLQQDGAVCSNVSSAISEYTYEVAAAAKVSATRFPGIQQCTPPSQFSTVDCATASMPANYSSRSFQLTSAAHTTLNSRVFPATYAGAYEQSTSPELTMVQAELSAIAAEGFVDQFTRLVGVRFLLFNQNLESFGLATVAVEQSLLDGSMVPFYEWHEASTDPLLYKLVLFCFLGLLSGFGLVLNASFFKAYAMQLWLSIDKDHVDEVQAFGSNVNAVPPNQAATSELRAQRSRAACRRCLGYPPSGRYSGRIFWHILLSPHFALLDAGIAIFAVVGVVVSVDNLFQNRMDISYFKFVALEASAASILAYVAVIL